MLWRKLLITKWDLNFDATLVYEFVTFIIDQVKDIQDNYNTRSVCQKKHWKFHGKVLLIPAELFLGGIRKKCWFIPIFCDFITVLFSWLIIFTLYKNGFLNVFPNLNLSFYFYSNWSSFSLKLEISILKIAVNIAKIISLSIM